MSNELGAGITDTCPTTGLVAIGNPSTNDGVVSIFKPTKKGLVLEHVITNPNIHKLGLHVEFDKHEPELRIIGISDVTMSTVELTYVFNLPSNVWVLKDTVEITFLNNQEKIHAS